MIRKPIDYMDKARRLAARRRGDSLATPGQISGPSPSVADEGCPQPLTTSSTLSTGFHDTRKYALIDRHDELVELVKRLEAATEIAFDVETYPLDESNAALDPRRGRVRLVSVAAEENAGGVVDVTMVDPLPLLVTLRGKTLVTHNGKFDLSFLKNCLGYEHDGPVMDTQVLDALLYYADGPRKVKKGWRGFPKNEVRRRSLKDLAEDYLGEELRKDEQVSDFSSERLAESQIRYSLRDSEILLPLKEALLRRIRKLGCEKVAELEARFLPALTYCENNGFALDVEGWREQADKAAEDVERLEAKCDSLAPPSEARKAGWNWGSVKQVGEVFDLLGVKLPKHPTGNPKTDDATLRQVSRPEQAVRLAEAILELRETKKRVSTWGRSWFEPPTRKPSGKTFDKDHQFVVEGRVHSSFTQVVKTGRISCSRPNLQNIPSALRKYFVAPPNRTLLIADYKHIELVPAAVIAGEDKMLEAFRRGEDVHALTARSILQADPARDGRPVTEEEVAAFRPLAKLVSFGVLYGISPKGLAKRLADQYGQSLSEDEARETIERFLDSYPALKRWYVEERKKAERGESRTRTLTGRLRLLDLEWRYGKWRAGPQVRLNTPVQGSAGDGFKYAAALLWERRQECPGDPRVVNMVHDELVVEIDEQHSEAGKAWLERCMVGGMQEVVGSEVPVSVELSVSENWSKGEG